MGLTTPALLICWSISSSANPAIFANRIWRCNFPALAQAAGCFYSMPPGVDREVPVDLAARRGLVIDVAPAEIVAD